MIRTTSEVSIHEGKPMFWTLKEGPPQTGDCIHVATCSRWCRFGYVTLVVESTEYCIRVSDLRAAIDNAMNNGE